MTAFGIQTKSLFTFAKYGAVKFTESSVKFGIYVKLTAILGKFTESSVNLTEPTHKISYQLI